MVREGEAPAEPSLHCQVGSAGEYPARQGPRPPENRKLLAVSKQLLATMRERALDCAVSHTFGRASPIAERDSLDPRRSLRLVHSGTECAMS